MTGETARRALCAVAVAVGLAALPAIYARAQTDRPSGGGMGRPMSGCGGMMGGENTKNGMTGGGMMSGENTKNGGVTGGMMGGGMMGRGERPNQQWRQ